MEQKKLIKSKNPSLYNKLLGFLIKKGGKSSAQNLLEEALFLVSRKIKKSKNILLLSLFLKVNTFVEVKKIKIRNRTLFVPFSVSLKRRSYLVIKWLLQSVKENKERISLAKKLAKEMREVLKKSKSKTLHFKNINNNQAFVNRSNSHFRW